MLTFLAELAYLAVYTGLACFIGQTGLGFLSVRLTGGLWFGTTLLLGMGVLAAELALFSLAGIPFNGLLIYGPWLTWLVVKLSLSVRASGLPLSGQFLFDLRKRLAETGVKVWLTRLLALVCGFFVLALLARQLLTPLIGTDGTLIWFIKARAFYLNGTLTLDHFENTGAHLDYPVAYPLIVCSVYLMGSGFQEQLGLGVLGLFMLAGLALLYGFCRRNLPAWQSLALVLAFIALPVFATMVYYIESLGQADFPVGVTFLLFSIFYSLGIEEEKPGFLAVALLAATLSASIKNEGLSFLGLAILAVGLTLLVKPGLRAGVFREKRLAVVLPVMVVAVGGWKIFTDMHHYQNDVMSNFSFDRLLAAIPAKYPEVLQRFWDVVANDASYWFLGLGLLFSLVVAFTASDKGSIAIIGLALVAFGQLLTYMLTYFISPMHLVWTHDTTFYRLLGQLVPVAFFIFCLAVCQNSRALNAREVSPA